MEYLFTTANVIFFVIAVLISVGLIELYFYLHFKLYDKKYYIIIPVLSLVFFGVVISFLNIYSTKILIYFAIWEMFFSYLCVRYVKGKNYLPYMLIAPAVIGLMMLLLYPFLFEIYLSFTDLKLTTIMQWKETGKLPFVGLKQYINVFKLPPLSETTFWQLFGRTLLWTFSNVFFHVLGGLLLALMLIEIKNLRGVYRMFLIIPWAMPQVVAVLSLRGEFHSEYGFVNIMIKKLIAAFPFLTQLGIGPVNWLSDHPLLTCTLINIWLGIPFMMVVILGGLQSISQSYYDAATIDGASYLQKLKYITLPLLKPVVLPAITLGTIWTFNNINIIYLVTGQAGGTERADILVSALYKAAFVYNRYSYSAAFAMIIFVILFLITTSYSKMIKVDN
ncbi:MAG: sugar ABC transporter permease [Elusimicrobiales bacterium]|jgi:arabinogalactan oligomer/maltooligosaccharide transport system permease protein|nr:sugar ABC transporter permease [Elusimicrobiales bacterium]NLH39439.1 sugar ABC transporter permease [Elusimicrobiota bacterium]